VKENGFVLLPIIITILIGVVGFLIYQNTQLTGHRTNLPFPNATTITQTPSSDAIPCGGWDTFGDVECKCSGNIEKFSCPSNAICDSGKNSCKGTCGECKCYQGSSGNGIETPCAGRDDFFK